MSKSKLLRVTQINAVYFDKEIFNVFKQHLDECLKFLPLGFTAKHESEIHLLLRLAILNYSVLKHNSTFGQKLLSIKYENLTATSKIFFVVYTAYEYIKQKLETNTPSHFLNTYFHNINLFVQLLRFWNISQFLRSGTKPLLIERLLGLNQIYSKDNAQRHYEDKYMTRELIWNGFIEILVYMLPLINYQKMTRTFRHLNPLHRKPQVEGNGKIRLDLESKCVHCGLPPIQPCHMGCIHVFCYVCLKGNQVADSKFECPVCEYSSAGSACLKVFVD